MKLIELYEPGPGWTGFELVRHGYHPEIFQDLYVDFEIILTVPEDWDPPQKERISGAEVSS